LYFPEDSLFKFFLSVEYRVSPNFCFPCNLLSFLPSAESLSCAGGEDVLSSILQFSNTLRGFSDFFCELEFPLFPSWPPPPFRTNLGAPAFSSAPFQLFGSSTAWFRVVWLFQSPLLDFLRKLLFTNERLLFFLDLLKDSRPFFVFPGDSFLKGGSRSPLLSLRSFGSLQTP